MSRRDEPGAAQGNGGKERRQGSGHRVMFEALVAVGGQGAGFEAESVDVSRDGMRLRTAYLPMPGDTLICRFDGGTGEVAVRGEVVWCNEEARGGEFGLAFVDLDEATAKALRALCEEEAEAEAAPEAPKAASQKGHRVRLHIEGLGSPMKARIRDADDGAVHVGSALEFLKVGRTLELEDVDQGARREAWVDDVKVEVDPASSVPQLVVSLRFDAIGTATATKRGMGSLRPDAADAMGATMKAAPTPALLAEEKRASKAKLGAHEDIVDSKEVSPATKRAGASAKVAKSEADDDASEATDSLDDDEIAGLRRNRLHDVGDKLKNVSSAAMGKLAPAMSGLGDRAKSLWGKVGANIDKRREMKEEQKPRRVTAPPPSGALKASGRKVVREEEELETSQPISAVPKRRRTAAIGAVIGLLAVFAIWGGAKAMSGGDKADVVTAAQMRDKEGAREKLPSIPGAPAVADVPLFGATPMSTTEQVVMPPQAISGNPAAGPAPGAPGGSSEDEGDGAAEGGKDGEAKADGPAQRKWGEGEVKNAKVLRIKMDGPLAGITGRDADGGFTITVPGRKSAASVSGLARKDKRIEAVDVVNKEEGAVVTVKFKNGEVPGFLAQAKGDRLEIAISSDEKSGKTDGPAKKVASKSKDKEKGKEKSKAKGKPKSR